LSPAEEIAVLLGIAGIERRPAAGGGTLMTESLLVLRRDGGDLDVLDQDGNRLGSVRWGRRFGWIQFGSSGEYEFVDAEDTCVLHVQAVGSLKGPAIKWVYELSVPHSSEATKLQRIDRSTHAASITQGQREVGWLRPLKRPDGFLIADRDDNDVGRVLVGSESPLRLLVLVNDSATEELRRVGLAAAVIADRELTERGGGGGGAA
jgi:hypothetical protein